MRMRMASTHRAASWPPAAYRASKKRRQRLALAEGTAFMKGLSVVSVDQGLALGTGLVQPLLEHGVADLLHVGLELGRWGGDGHAVGLECGQGAFVDLAGLCPATGFGIR